MRHHNDAMIGVVHEGKRWSRTIATFVLDFCFFRLLLLRLLNPSTM